VSISSNCVNKRVVVSSKTLVKLYSVRSRLGQTKCVCFALEGEETLLIYPSRRWELISGNRVL